MPPYQQSEDQAREQIDAMLEAAGWTVHLRFIRAELILAP